MQASMGDRMVTESNKVDSPRQEGEIVEVRDKDGGPRSSSSGATGTKA